MRYNRDSRSKSFELGVMKQSLVKDKSYRFALERIRLAQGLREQREFELARQVLRAGTSIGANVEESLAGLS